MLTDGDERFGSTDPAVLRGVVPQRLHQPGEQADVGVRPTLVLVLHLAVEVRLRVEQVELLPVAEELTAHLCTDAADGQRLEHRVALLVATGGGSGVVAGEVRPRPQVGKRHRLVVLRQLLQTVGSRAEERLHERAELREEVGPRGGHDGELRCGPLAPHAEAGEPMLLVDLPLVVEEPCPHGRGQRHGVGAQFRRVAGTDDDRGGGHLVVTDAPLRDHRQQSRLRGGRDVGHLVHQHEGHAVFGLVPQ